MWMKLPKAGELKDEPAWSGAYSVGLWIRTMPLEMRSCCLEQNELDH